VDGLVVLGWTLGAFGHILAYLGRYTLQWSDQGDLTGEARACKPPWISDPNQVLRHTHEWIHSRTWVNVSGWYCS
jgi:hypothetical protein